MADASKGVERSIKSIHLGPSPEIGNAIIARLLPDAPDEVKETIAKYGMGNPGATRVLAERAGQFKTAKEVTDLVGWELDDHTLERTGDIWDKFKDEKVPGKK